MGPNDPSSVRNSVARYNSQRSTMHTVISAERRNIHFCIVRYTNRLRSTLRNRRVSGPNMEAVLIWCVHNLQLK